MMKRLLFTAALAGIGHCLSAQTPQISSFNHDGDSCWVSSSLSHSVNMWGNVSNATAGLTVTTYWGDGASSNSSVGFQAASGWFSAAHNYTLPGTYSVMAVLRDAASNPLDSSMVTVNAFCYSLQGMLYKKNDANCTYDNLVDDPIYAYQQIEVRKNNVPIDTFTAAGYYNYNISSPDLTSEFSLHPLNNLNGYQQVCPSTATFYKVRLDTLAGYNNHFDYGFTCSSTTGFDLFTYMSGFLRFVNNSYLTIYAGNSACTPQNGVVTLNIDPQYSFVGSWPAPSSVSGQTVTWNASNLSGTNSAYISVTLHAVDTLTPGDTSCSVVSITPTSGDINPSNNTYNYCDLIHASYDPNDKKVSPMSDIAAGQELTYTINFENLGDDTAFNVHVLDTLSTNLDPTSFELVASSHPVRTNLFAYNSTKIVRFDFVDINLGDKNHPQTNKGFIIYKAKAKSSLSAGSEITNTGHIYFDINPAIVTNTVMSKIPNPTSIKGINKEDGISVYPNPADDVLFIENKNGLYTKAMLVNTLGQVVLESKIAKGANRLSTAALTPGMYYLVINGSNGSRSVKITKK